MNPGLGVLLLVVTIINLTNPRIQQYYASLGVGPAGFYALVALRVALAGALILGRDRRVATALRVAFLFGALAFLLLPGAGKTLAYPIGLLVAFMLYKLTPHSEVAPRREAPLNVARLAGQAARMFGLLCATAATMCLALLAVRAGLLGDGNIIMQMRGAFGSLDTASVSGIAAIMAILATGMIVPALQRVTGMVLCVWALGTAGAQLAAGLAHFVPGTLAWAAIFGGISSLLPRPSSHAAARFDAGTLGCLGLAAVLAFAGMWDFTSARVSDAYAQAGYPDGFVSFLGGADILASVLLCLPAARRFALAGVATFSLALGAIGVMHGRVADAPLTVFTLAACIGLLAAITRGAEPVVPLLPVGVGLNRS
jgi:hypothetical protein